MPELETIVQGAMKALVQLQYLYYETHTGRAESAKASAEAVFTKHFDDRQVMNDVYQLAVCFNNLADYDRAIQDIEAQADKFNDSMVEKGFADMERTDDLDQIESAMSYIVYPMILFSKQDMLKRVAGAYAYLLLEWQKLPAYLGKDSTGQVEVDSILAQHLEQAFAFMKEQGTLDHWNVLAAEKLDDLGQQSLRHIQQKLQPKI